MRMLTLSMAAIAVLASTSADAQWRRGWDRGEGIIGGIIGGAIVGSQAPYYQPPVVYVPQPVYVPPQYEQVPAYVPPVPPVAAIAVNPAVAIAYCARRFRTYDPTTGTYFGPGGIRHSCP
jgi:hypothetical protein